MKKTEMLKKNYEYKRVLTKGKYYSGKYIEAFIKTNDNNKNFLGIAIGVKIAKAVKRNHIKRLIRENYKNLEEKINSGNTVVFLWKKKIDIKMRIIKISNKIWKIFSTNQSFLLRKRNEKITYKAN